jgi:hypothetical protein
MHRSSYVLIYLVLMLIVSSCIKPFYPEIESQDANKLVISGQVTDDGEIQTVNISITSPIGEPEYLPVSGCTVMILDNSGNEFLMTDTGDGNYQTIVDLSYLLPGASFQLQVTTAAGDRIESSFDTLSACPEVDSVYYMIENIEGSVAGEFTRGIQFYTNLNGTSESSRYFRWDVVETWEYHAEYPLEWYYDGMVHHVWPPDYSRMVCWSTQKIPNIYTLTTRNLVENRYEKYPLHYVDNLSSRLMYGYSLLIRQNSLSEAAYVYWDKLRINSEQEGGLYQTQPLAIRGNMQNLSNPGQDVLGFFGASSVKSKRIFVLPVPELPLDFSNMCNLAALRLGLREITPDNYPGYLLGNAEGYSLVQLSEECVNCLSLGGSNIKPDFWPY